MYLLREWYQTAWVYDVVLDRTIFNPDIGLNAPTALLVGGLLLLLWAIAGGTDRTARATIDQPQRDGTISRRLRAMGACNGCDARMEPSFRSSTTGERMGQR